jgi:carbon storage regulator CsrA
MLVISRRAEQQIVFPHLNIQISILQIRGRLVKLGIDAPDSIQVLRREIVSEGDAATPPGDHKADSSVDDEESHRRRNELNRLQLQLQVIQRRIDRGEVLDAEATLRGLLSGLQTFEQEFTPMGALELPEQSGRPIRVLVVEDCDNERRLMAYLLATHGFDVHVARDGIEAIRHLRMWGSKPDFVLMDMQMPLANGLETLQRIREDEFLCNLKVFAVTASPRTTANEPLARGWDEWFSKPLDIQKLIARLRMDDSASRCNSAT